MINRSERVADLGGVVVGSSAGMIQTLENYTTGMKKRRFLPINPSVKWRIDQLKKLRETLPGSDSTFNPVDVKIEMFSKGTKWPLVVFCFFSLIVFPFIFISTIYQLFRLPELSFGALFLLTCEVLCKFLLTLWGLLMGLRILKGTDLPYFRLWIFCLANLAFIIADSTIVVLFFSEMNRFVIFYSLLKSQWLPIVFFLAGSIIYVLPEKLITPTRAMRDFSDYK